MPRNSPRSRENRRLLPGVRIPEPSRHYSRSPPRPPAPTSSSPRFPRPICGKPWRRWPRIFPPAARSSASSRGSKTRRFCAPARSFARCWGSATSWRLCGPSHAEEFTRRLPASVVVAGTNPALLSEVQTLFTTDRFRVYTNRDIVGVELAAALKNVVAIAAGICDGLRYGDNAKAALLTRGIVEIARFGVALGAEPDDIRGPGGNRRPDHDLLQRLRPQPPRRRAARARGPAAGVLSEIHGVAEGVTTCQSVYGLAQKHGIDMPIITEVYRVLFEGKSPEAATNSLMMRPLRAEAHAK